MSAKRSNEMPALNFLLVVVGFMLIITAGKTYQTHSGLIDHQLLGQLSPLFIELNQKLQLNNNSTTTSSTISSTTTTNKTTTPPSLKPLIPARASQLIQSAVNASHNSLINQTPRRPLLMSLQQAQIKPSNLSSLGAVRQRWRQMELQVGDSLANLGTQFRSALDELGPRSANISSGCRQALHELLDGLASQKLWASQTLDASARLPSGLLEGTLTELGHFDQCLSLTYPPSPPTEQQQQQQLKDPARRNQVASGQYCSIQIKPPLVPRQRLHTVCQRLPALSASSSNFSQLLSAGKTFKLLSQNSQHFYYAGLRLGLCLPSKCSKGDVQLLLSAYLAKFELLGQVKSCQVLSDDNSSRLDSVQQSIVAALFALVLLVMLGTMVDLASSSTRDKSQVKVAAAGDETMGATKIRPTHHHHHHNHRQANTTDCSSNSSQELQVPSANQRANGRRWLYQVYRSPPVACQLHHQHPACSPGMQHNPLVASADLLLGSSSKQGNILGGQFSTLHSHSRSHHQPPSSEDECHLAAGELSQEEEDEMLRMVADEGRLEKQDLEGEEGEEAWIAKLERNQAAALGKLHGLPDPRRRRKRKLQPSPEEDMKFRALLRAALVCFSIRSNLRLIGRHQRAAIASGNQKQEASSGVKSAATSSQPPPKAKQELADSDIKVIHGLRTVTMIWIIFGHTIGLVNPEMMNNLFAVAQLSCSSRLLQALLNATLAVNTFFMISGLVTMISLVRKCESANRLLNPSSSSESNKQHNNQQAEDPESSSMDFSNSSMISSLGSSSQCISRDHRRKRHECGRAAGHKKTTSGRQNGWPPGDFQPITWLALRYLRLTPAYAVTIGLSILMPLAGSGPFWAESAGQLGPACRDNWWSNLIYANNFINTDRLCLIHSWYLSNDWQFFLVTLLLIAIGYKSRRLALVLLASLLVGSSAATFALTVSNEFPPTIVSTSPAVAERWLFIHSLYYKPWPHLSSYLVGLVTGYLLIRKDHIRLSSAARYVGWLIASLLAFALLNSIYPWNMGLQVEPLLTGLHSATFRTLWAGCCAWLVFALATKPQTPLAKLLGWHGFQVSSRLTYCAYLVHPLIIYYHFGTLRERMDSSVYGQLHRFIATLGLSYLIALLLSLMIESPSIQLQRLLVTWFTSSQNKKSSTSCYNSYRATASNREHRDSSCSGTSGTSWIGTSSFGEQSSSATSSNLALVVASENLAAAESGRGGKRAVLLQQQQQPPACCLPVADRSQQHKNQQMIAQQGYQQNSQQDKSAAAAAMDADFQRKLAQAISRGFRLRSKLANGGGHTINGPPPPQPPNLPETQAIKRQPETTQPEVQRSRPNSGNQTGSGDNNKPKRVEFSTFFVGHPPQGFSTFTNNYEQQQLAAAAVAERQRRRSHDLIMMTRHNHHQLAPPTQNSSLQQPVVDDEQILPQKALLTRSQNQLDQFNPRTGSG